jgi:hypothetical protein
MCREVIVGVSGGSAASHNQSLDVAIGHHEIGERDVRRVQQHIHLPAETADRDIIHSEADRLLGRRHAVRDAPRHVRRAAGRGGPPGDRRAAARCATCRSACAAPISRSPTASWRPMPPA